MATIRKVREFSSTIWNAQITSLTDEITRIYTDCTLKVIGINSHQIVNIIIKAIESSREDILFSQEITLAEETRIIGPIPINRQCALSISGIVKGTVSHPAHCKIVSAMTYDATSLKTLRIGVFFDGTGCNAYNSLDYASSSLSEADFVESLHKKVRDNIIPRSYFYSSQLSQVTCTSNIWKLYKSFNEGQIDAQIYQVKTYVEGTGTKKGKPDSVFTMGTGWSPPLGPQTGVIAKTDDAVQQITDLLAEQGDNFDRVELCLFGFSRGATSARHFANRIENQDRELLAAFNIGKYGVPEVKFIGLYDSVAAILALSVCDVDVGDSRTGDVDISMDEVIADDVFHITAGHEVRENFSLSHVTPVYGKELQLPGVHSDIGGSFQDILEERMYLTQIIYSSSWREVENKDTTSYKTTSEKLEKLTALENWGRIYEESGIVVSSEVLKRPLLPTLYANAVQLHREAVYSGLDRVSFQTMRYYSEKIGLAFSKLPDEKVEVIPEDLRDLLDQALQQVDRLLEEGEASSLTNYLTPILGAKYVHNSAFWDEVPSDWVIDETGIIDDATFNLLLINRPHESFIRREYNADGSVFSDAK